MTVEGGRRVCGLPPCRKFCVRLFFCRGAFFCVCVVVVVEVVACFCCVGSVFWCVFLLSGPFPLLVAVVVVVVGVLVRSAIFLLFCMLSLDANLVMFVRVFCIISSCSLMSSCVHVGCTYDIKVRSTGLRSWARSITWG